jgi:3-oxoacyl-[acyl-carrier protein] reductase
MDLAGRVILITGGGRGIGKACAIEAAKRGAMLAVADVNGEAARQSTQEITAMGAECIPIEVDISLESDTLRMVKSVTEKYKRIDALINNAAMWGNLTRKRFNEMPVDEWDKVMAVNLRGPFLCTRAVFPAMQQQGYGKVVNITSTTAFFGSPFFLHYVTSKAGIIGMTRSLARELGEFGIRVNAVAPGFTLTEASLSNTGEERSVQLASQTILKRVAGPGDIVGTILFLTGPDSDFMTGQTVVVDGGMVMH